MSSNDPRVTASVFTAITARTPDRPGEGRKRSLDATAVRARKAEEWFNLKYEQWKEDLTPHEKHAISAALVVGFKTSTDHQFVCLPGFGVFKFSEGYDPEDMGAVDRFPGRVRVLAPEPFYPPMQFRAQRLLGVLQQASEAREELNALLQQDLMVEELLSSQRDAQLQQATKNSRHSEYLGLSGGSSQPWVADWWNK